MMKNSINDMLHAMQQQNLVYNHDFLYYSNKEGNVVKYNHPDGWGYEDTGANGKISFDEGTNSCLIQKSTDDSKMAFSQIISEFPRWKDKLLGKKVTACAVIINPEAAATTFELTFSITDGVSISSKTFLYKAGEKKAINLELNVNEKATKLEVNITCSTPKAIIYVNKVYANVGVIALENLPCIVQGVIGERKQYIATENAPAEELSLCNAIIELSTNYTRLRSVLNNRFGVNSENGNPYLVNMAGYFSRAWDNGSKIDPDANDRETLGKSTIKGDHVSTLEKDVFLKHNHGLDFSINKTILTGDKGAAIVIDPTSKSKTNDEANGKETRPINIAELYTIKWA